VIVIFSLPSSLFLFTQSRCPMPTEQVGSYWGRWSRCGGMCQTVECSLHEYYYNCRGAVAILTRTVFSLGKYGVFFDTLTIVARFQYTCYCHIYHQLIARTFQINL
jgi:hypothetical protein